MTKTDYTDYRQELKGRILEMALRLFKEKGVKAVRMDDIAKSLNISKRTLYEIYPNKEELLLASLRAEREAFNKRIEAVASQPGMTVMDIVIAQFQLRLKSMSEVNTQFFVDVHMYKRATQYFEERAENDAKQAQAFIQRGIREGYFLPNVDYEMMFNLGNHLMSYAMGNQLYKPKGMEHLIRNFNILFLRSCCTQKGIAAIDEILLG